MNLNGVKLTWLGHSTFLVETPEQKKILVDPWLAGNPSCPEAFHALAPDAVVATHGHFDHIGDLGAVIERTTGPICGIWELTGWAQKKFGLAEGRAMGMNKGGTAQLGELDVMVGLTDARHSSSWEDNTYLGDPCGVLLRFSNDVKIYFAGDTCVFGDMALIRELFSPDVAVLPIGDRFTMGPRAAAIATRLLQPKYVVPCHYGTFPLLTGTPEQFAEQLATQQTDAQLVTCEVGTCVG